MLKLAARGEGLTDSKLGSDGVGKKKSMPQHRSAVDVMKKTPTKKSQYYMGEHGEQGGGALVPWLQGVQAKVDGKE